MKLAPLASAIALATALAPAARAGLPFDQFIAFGASYDDSGQFPDPAFGFDTGLRFTNIDPVTGQRGLSMPEWLARDLGIGPLAPSMPITAFGPRSDAVDTDNINFAVGGYRSEEVLESITGTQRIAIGGFNFSSPGFLARIAAGTLEVSPNALYYALPAGDDIRDLNDPAATAAVSAQVVQALVDAGARYILLPTLPKLGSFAERSNYVLVVPPPGGMLPPDSPTYVRSPLGIARTEAAIAFNEAFGQELLGMQGNFIRVDVTTLFDEVLANPASFGYPTDIDQTVSCFDAAAAGGPGCDEPPGRGAASGGDPGDFVFNDGLHPTQAAARAAADLMESVIRAPGHAALLPEAALAGARAQLNVVGSHLASHRFAARERPFEVFATVQGRELDTADAFATPEASSDATDLTVGASYALDDAWFLGAAIGSQQDDTDLEGGSFEAEGLSGSLFAGWRCEGWFADLVLGLARTDLEDVSRDFSIGPVQQRTERGDTEADALSLAASLGVDMMPAGSAWRFGPFLAAEYVDVEVDGYEEDGNSSSAMAFDDLARESLLGRAGVFASYPFRAGGAELELRGDVSYFEEFEDEADDVRAVSKNLAAGPWFRMPGYAIDDNGVRATVGLDARWQGGIAVGVDYRYDDNDAEAQYLGLSARYAF